MKNFLIVLLLIISTFTPNKADAQAYCNNPLGSITAGATWQYLYHTCLGYVTFQATAGCTYEFTYCNSFAPSAYYSADPYLTISTQSTSGGLAQNDDYCGLGTYLSWTATTSGTYYLNLGNCCSSQCGCGQNRNMGYRLKNCVNAVDPPASITASVNPLCSGNTTQLSANGANGTVYWYTGGCGTTQIGTGNTQWVSPTVTTTYYAKNFDGFQYSATCASITIIVNTTIGTMGSISGNNTIIAGTAETYSIPILANASYQWAFTESVTAPLWLNMPGVNTNSTTFTWPQTTTDGAVRVTVASSSGCNTQMQAFPIIVNGALPIELLSFTGEGIGNNIFLYWSTASEHNNEKFDIYRSTSGYDWCVIGSIPGAINSTIELDYTYIDKDLPYIEFYYYKLNQVDLDGANEFSDIIAIHLATRSYQCSNLGYYDLQGRLIDIDKVPPGIYLRVCDEGTKRYIKFY